jgi:hypothetical protein
VLRQGRLARAAVFTGPAGSPSGAPPFAAGRAARSVTSPSHAMLSVQLTGFTAGGEQLASNLTFVELASPEAKVAASQL